MKTIHIVKKYFLLIILVFSFYTCKKNEDTNLTSNNNAITHQLINANVIGKVIDEHGFAVQYAEINVLNTNATTDKNGMFYLHNVQIPSKNCFIQVIKEGYCNTGRTIQPIQNTTNYIEITLLTKTLVGNFESNRDANINIGSNATIEFIQSSISYEDGRPYQGEVKVYANYLNPNDENLSFKMPGDLLGINDQANLVGLQSYGMIHAELRSSGGHILRIADGYRAKITMKIPETMMQNAEEEIPLWHFDEQIGIWKQEGKALKQDNSYEGVVSHFSWWNCDLPYKQATLKMRFINNQGTPISNIMVRILNTNNGDHRTAINNYDGTIQGIVYGTVLLKLYVKIDDQFIFIRDIAPLQSASVNDLGDIVVDSRNLHSYQINGNLIDCNGAPMPNGIAIISCSNYTSHVFSDSLGRFSINFITNNEMQNFYLSAIDYNNNRISENINHSFTGPITEISDIIVCNSAFEIESFAFNINNSGNRYLNPHLIIARLVNEKLIISYDDMVTNNNGVKIDFELDTQTNKIIRFEIVSEYDCNNSICYNFLYSDFTDISSRFILLYSDLIGNNLYYLSEMNLRDIITQSSPSNSLYVKFKVKVDP